MNSLKRSAIVPYSARQMFELVNNIEEYPRFLPWCHSTEIISRTDDEIIATLEINWKGMRKKFTTRNTLKQPDRMDMNLITGPLKHMEGIWNFQPLNEKACKVLLDLEFEFAGSFIDRLFEPVFQHIANSLVDAFCKRAVELYGSE
jgi:ribosome-associated toxin RatA of RatAB toxin-antitoxin module